MPPEESHEPPCAEQQTKATILIVENDEANRELIVLLMSTFTGYHYCLVSNPYQALYVTKEVKPNLCIVDYRLPGMNGLKLYDRLHATPGLEAIPTLLLTATRLEALRPEIEQRQLTVLEKPIDLDVFLLTVQRLLGRAPD